MVRVSEDRDFEARNDQRVAGRLPQGHLGDARGKSDAHQRAPGRRTERNAAGGDGRVRVDRSGSIDLTRKGRQFAQRLALRHQLAEMLLTDVIGLSWAKAHDEAERLEHAISPEVEALLRKRFGDKKSCPHGVPMRGGIAKLRKQGAVLLSDLRADDEAEILCVYEKDAQFLEFLEGLHLRPSATVEVLRREYDETMTLHVSGKTMHLGKPATSRIWVRRLSA